MSSEPTAGSCSGVDTKDDKSSAVWSAMIALVFLSLKILWVTVTAVLFFLENIKTIFSRPLLPDGDFFNDCV